MVTALVLLNVERDSVNDVAEKLSEMKGVSEVYSVAGRYDLAERFAVVALRASRNAHDTAAIKQITLQILAVQKLKGTTP